ncbi:MAG: DUF362 domain-containing protein [Endomicrobiaceae bacterium]|nr:DUF362 domain-containing protein [Endomicrobiaceae bacterium]
MTKTIISSSYCDKYDNNIDNIVLKTLQPLGVLTDIIKPGSKILIKPNLLSARRPDEAITTHPSIVKAVIKIVKSCGATPFIGDSPGNVLKGIEHIWQQTEMAKIAEEENVKLITFENTGIKKIEINHPTIKTIALANIIFDFDSIINIPKLKTHTLMGLTCGVKNFYGCVPGITKIEYHKLAASPHDFALLLSEIYKVLKDKILFTVLDGVEGLEGNGPSTRGIKRNYNIICVSRDTVALDTYITKCVEKNYEKNFFIKTLKNVGNTDFGSFELIGGNVEKFNFENVKLPITKILNIIPVWLARLVGKYIGKLIWIKPVIEQDKCVKCGQCIKSCPAKTITKQNNGIIYIDKSNCISCFCCHELCGYKAIDIELSLLAKLFIKTKIG